MRSRNRLGAHYKLKVELEIEVDFDVGCEHSINHSNPTRKSPFRMPQFDLRKIC